VNASLFFGIVDLKRVKLLLKIKDKKDPEEFMYKTIIWAMETSKEGKSVLTKASELAKKYGAKLIVMHVIP